MALHLKDTADILAAKAVKLNTARTINGVSFDGTANITITANPNSHTHDDRYYTESEINTKLSTQQTSLTSGKNFVHDTRGANRLPNYYPRRETRYDFVESAQLGCGGDTWTTLLTVSPWASYGDSHRPQQLAFKGAGGLSFRYATSDTVWSGWQTIYSTINKPSWNDILSKPSSFTPASHTHDDRYYTESEANGRYIGKSGDHTITGKIVVADGNRDGGMYGTYVSSKVQNIWSMGTSYKVDANGAGFANLYGAAYRYNSTGGGISAGGHQFVWCQNGSVKVALGDGINTTGTVNGANVTVGGNNVYHVGRKPTWSDVGAIQSGNWKTNGGQDLLVHNKRAMVGMTSGILHIGYGEDFPNIFIMDRFQCQNASFKPSDHRDNQLYLGTSSAKWRALYASDVYTNCINFRNVHSNDYAYIDSGTSGDGMITTNMKFVLGDDSEQEYWGWYFGNSYTNKYRWSAWLKETNDNHCMYFIAGKILPDSSAALPNYDVGSATYCWNTMYAKIFSTVSDKNMKKNIEYIHNKSRADKLSYKNFIKNELNIATYNLREYETDDSKREFKGETKLDPLRDRPGAREVNNPNSPIHVGFIAQDVVNTDVGKQFVTVYENGRHFYDISSYANIIAQALKEEIIEKDEIINKLTENINNLTERLELIERTLSNLGI